MVPIKTVSYQNLDESRRQVLLELGVLRKEDVERDGEADEEEEVGHEEVRESDEHGDEHLDVFAETRNFADKQHLKKIKKLSSRKCVDLGLELERARIFRATSCFGCLFRA